VKHIHCKFRQTAASLAIAMVVSLSLCRVTNAEEPTGGDTPAQATNNASPGTAAAAPDEDWHADLALYLWLAGTHGTIGIGGHDVDYRASPSDLLSHFRFGLMGTVQANHGRFVLINDLMWVRLRATNTTTLPLPGQPTLSAEAKAWQFILTPEIGYRFLDREKIKIDALMGLRYWHVGSSLQFTPSPFGRTFSGSLNWADPLMGTRILFPLSPKLLVTIWGDAGGWGAGSQLDYQIFGAIGYRLSEKFSLGGGYRYLFVNYRPGNSGIYESALSGAVIGVNYHYK